MVTATESLRHVVIAAALLASFSRPALGADPDDSAKERARELMTKGRKARAGADLAGALQSFSEADEIMHVPTTGLEVARALKDLGRLVDSAHALERLEALPAAAAEPDVFVKARRAAKDMKLELDARIPSLRISASPREASGTQLTLDGKPIDPNEAASGLRVDPGRHVATAERRGVVQQRIVQLTESGSADVAFDFGSARESVPAPRPRPAKATARSYVVYGLTGFSVAAVGTGIGLAVWSTQRKASLERECSPHCSASEVTDLRIGYVAANVTTAVGVAAGLAALTVHFVGSSRRPSKRDSARSLSVTAGAGPGVTLLGTF